jgi:predicted aspartyl protease
MIYEFEKDDDSGVIFVTLELENKYTLKMVLDTAASCTTIDTTALYMAGYSIDKKLETCTVETANGIIKVNIYEINCLTALGRTVYNMPVQVYDFFAHGILSDYDGLLGLDFFKNTILHIDMKNNTIEVL